MIQVQPIILQDFQSQAFSLPTPLLPSPQFLKWGNHTTPFTTEFLKWTLPSLNLDKCSFVNKGVAMKKQQWQAVYVFLESLSRDIIWAYNVCKGICLGKNIYGKCPKISNTKVSDKMTYANSADPDQTAPDSDQGLHCLPFH